MFRTITLALSITALFLATAAFAGKAPAGCTNKAGIVSVVAAPLPVVAGAVEKITFSVKNYSAKAAISVEWVLTDETGAVVGKGTLSLAKGATGSGSADWTATAGAHELKLVIDPANKLGESGTCLADNTKSVSFNV